MGYTLVYTAVASIVALIFYKTVYAHFRYPRAKGPFLAQWSPLWYIWRVYQWNFHLDNVELHRKYGPVVRVAPDKYSIDDPTAFKQIYNITNSLQKSSWYTGSSDPAIGPNHNIFSTQDKEVHNGMRRRQAAFYSMTTVKSYEPFVDQSVATLLTQFRKLACSKARVDLQLWLQCYAFDTISHMTYGIPHGFMASGAQDPSGYLHYIWVAQSFGTLVGLTGIWGLPLLFLRLGNPMAKFGPVVASFEKHAEEQLAAAGKESLSSPFSNSKDTPTSDTSAEKPQPKTFHQKIVAAREADPAGWLKYRTFVASMSNMIAGSDTTAITLTSILAHALSTPGVWSRLRSELSAALDRGEVSTPITFEESSRLPYFQRVVKESLRLHPPVGLPLWRLSPSPAGITLCDTYFPPGSWIGINAWVAHHNPIIFPEPEVFDPERWNPALVGKEALERMENYFLAFGSGNRACMGRNISLLEIGKVVPELVRGFDFELEEKWEHPLGVARRGRRGRTENNWFCKQVDVWTGIKVVETIGGEAEQEESG